MSRWFCTLFVSLALGQALLAQPVDGRNKPSGKKAPIESPDLARYALFEKTAPRPESTSPVDTQLPLKIEPGMSIALIGNTLLDRSQDFGYLETLIQQAYPAHRLTVRTLAWSADSLHYQPRPANFADTDQHLVFVKADIIFAAYGFNESFAGPDGLAEFKTKLTEFVQASKAKAFNGKKGPQLVLLSPIASENITEVDAAKNNKNIQHHKTTFLETVSPTCIVSELTCCVSKLMNRR